jgi:hypothetical protein
MILKTFNEKENPFLNGLTEYLLNLKFPKKKCGIDAKGKPLSRANIVNHKKGKEVECIILGKVRCYNKVELVNSTMTRRFPDLFEILEDFIYHEHPEFKFTSICLNKNITTAWHKDKNNHGKSMCISLGDHSGGGIELDLEDGSKTLKINNKNKFLLYDGSKLKHRTIKPRKGNRIAIIFYSANEYKKT